MKERGCMAPDDRNPDNNDRNHDRNCRILVNIVTMEDLSLRGNVYRDGQHLRYDFCCDEIIGKILWELIDNPYAAEALGAGDLGDLVELLEVAARCESKESHIRQRDLKVGFSQLVSCQSANIMAGASGVLVTRVHLVLSGVASPRRQTPTSQERA